MANRHEWEFEYTASKLAEGARKQHAFRLDRVRWWKDKKAAVMAEIKESGLEVNESVASSISNYSNTSMPTPQISVRGDLQKKLSECHGKIQAHQTCADEYDGWVQVLSANPESRLKLTHSDWLFFFGK